MWVVRLQIIGNVNTDTKQIIFILTDDLGWGEVNQSPSWALPVDPLSPGGGSPVVRRRNQQYLITPNLERFAQQGLRAFLPYAPASLCTPSRASIFLGRGVGSTGLAENDAYFELTDNTTFSRKIKALGYRTGYFGKWGIGDLEGGPWNHGFDFFYGQTGNVEAHCVFPPFLTLYDSKKSSPPKTLDDLAMLRPPIANNSAGIHFTPQNCPQNPFATCIYDNDLTRDAFFDFLRNQSIAAPFFAVWAPSYPHFASYNVGDPWNAAHQGATRRYSRPNTMPEFFRGHAGRIEAHLDVDIGTFLDMMSANPALDQNTLVVFSSDNGPPNGLEYFDSDGGLRGGKRNVYEAGVRVPTMIRWTKKIPPGSSSRTPFALYELANIFVNLASQPSVQAPLLLSWITGKEILSRPPMLLKTCSALGAGTVKTMCYSATYNLTNWSKSMIKLVTDVDGSTELFDLVKDPTESHPIRHAASLLQAMRALRDQLSGQ